MKYDFDNVLNGYNLALTADVRVFQNNDLGNLCGLRDRSIIFCKTDFVGALFKRLSKHSGKHTLITHFSDYPVDDRLAAACPDSVRDGGGWWAQNADTDAYFVHPLPIGVENHGGPTPAHRSYFDALFQYANLDAIDVSSRRNDINSVYCNVGNTHPARASKILALSGAAQVSIHGRKPFREYFSDLSRHKFVASPRGNGIDCLRTWESLYCGAIPLIDAHRMYTKISPELTQISDWGNPKLPFFFPNVYEMLDVNYWRAKIRAAHHSIA